MKKITVFLNTIEAVKNFVSAIKKYPFNAEFVSGRYVVDAKSIMGIFSLNLSVPIELHINSEEPCIDDFINDIKEYIVE